MNITSAISTDWEEIARPSSRNWSKPADLKAFQNFAQDPQNHLKIVEKNNEFQSIVVLHGTTGSKASLDNTIPIRQIIADFKDALTAKYGAEIANFAFSSTLEREAMNSGLSGLIIKNALEKATQASSAKTQQGGAKTTSLSSIGTKALHVAKACLEGALKIGLVSKASLGANTGGIAGRVVSYAFKKSAGVTLLGTVIGSSIGGDTIDESIGRTMGSGLGELVGPTLGTMVAGPIVGPIVGPFVTSHIGGMAGAYYLGNDRIITVHLGNYVLGERTNKILGEKLAVVGAHLGDCSIVAMTTGSHLLKEIKLRVWLFHEANNSERQLPTTMKLESLPVEGAYLGDTAAVATTKQSLTRRAYLELATKNLQEERELTKNFDLTQIPEPSQKLTPSVHGVLPIENPIGGCYLCATINFVRRMMKALPSTERPQALQRLPYLTQFIENKLPAHAAYSRLLIQEVATGLLTDENKTTDLSSFTFTTNYENISAGVSLRGNNPVECAERMLRGLGIESNDQAQVSNKNLESETALRRQGVILPVNLKAIADLRWKQDQIMTMQDVMDGDRDSGNIHAPQTILIGLPPPILSFKFERRAKDIHSPAFFRGYQQSQEKKNYKYSVHELMEPLMISFQDGMRKGVALYEPIALTCLIDMKEIGPHEISFTKDGTTGQPTDWTFFNNSMTQPYNQPTHTSPWKGKDGTTELDPGDLNDPVILTDYCDMIGYLLKSYH